VASDDQGQNKGRGEIRKEGGKAHKCGKTNLYKTIKVPVKVKAYKVKATLKHGILEITLPKAEVVKKVKIEVKPI